jgi:hypothetical protein
MAAVSSAVDDVLAQIRAATEGVQGVVAKLAATLDVGVVAVATDPIVPRLILRAQHELLSHPELDGLDLQLRRILQAFADMTSGERLPTSAAGIAAMLQAIAYGYMHLGGTLEPSAYAEAAEALRLLLRGDLGTID